MAKKNAGVKTITLLLMILSLGIIYFFPYLSYRYYTPLMEAFGLTGQDAAFGKLLNMYGIANVILYIPGGWIADKFDCKKLMVFSMIGTGVLALWESTFPSYQTLTLIYILYAVTTVLTFWSASVKCINVLADADEQGSMFGSLETGRNTLALVLNTVWVTLFTVFGNIRIIMIIAAILHILAGVALAFLMPKTEPSTTNQTIGDSLKAMVGAFKLPATYLLAGMIFCGSMVGASVSYFAPYLEKSVNAATTVTTAFAQYNTTICGIVGAALAAILAKKFKSSSRVLIFSGSLLIVMFIGLVLVPASASVVVPVVMFMIIGTLCQYTFRALYYATVDEAGTPKNQVGVLLGIASILGFLPDTFYTSLCGSWLEADPVNGYKKIFMCCVAAGCLGTVSAFISERRIQKYRASLAAADK